VSAAPGAILGAASAVLAQPDRQEDDDEKTPGIFFEDCLERSWPARRLPWPPRRLGYSALPWSSWGCN